jgi:hypothetical protein
MHALDQTSAKFENVAVSAFGATLNWPFNPVCAHALFESLNNNEVASREDVHTLKIMFYALKRAHHPLRSPDNSILTNADSKLWEVDLNIFGHKFEDGRISAVYSAEILAGRFYAGTCEILIRHHITRIKS